MPDDPTLEPAAVSVAALDAALALLCCRFGMPEEEAYRRGRARALLASSRALASALDQFVVHAAPRTRGEHCTSDMQPDARALAQALSDWSYSVNASAAAYDECRRTDSASVPPATPTAPVAQPWADRAPDAAVAG